MAEDSRKKRKLLHAQPDGFLPSKKPPQRIHAPKFQSAFASSSSAPSLKLTTKPPSFPPRPQPPPQSIKPAPTAQEQKKPVQMRQQPIPNRPLHPDPQPSKPTIPMKRQEPPNVPTAQNPSRPLLSSSNIFIKERPAPSALSTKPLQKLVAPPRPDLTTTTDTREMKPILATHFASLADASFDDDSVDISSLLIRLQEHRATAESGDKHKPDVLISPQKNKHIRGGLAAHASHLFKKSHTSLYLWRTSLESQPHHQTSSDLSFRISKVVHTIYTGSYTPCISITLCRILTPTRPFTSRKQCIYILLNLPKASKPSSLCNPENILEGSTLRIWRPWQEVSLVHPSSGDSIVAVEMPMASLPLPSSNDSSNMPYDENIHNTVLLCSRYSIITQDST